MPRLHSLRNFPFAERIGYFEEAIIPMKSWRIYYGAFFLIALTGCSTSQENTLDGPTSGRISIAADNTLFPIVDAEVDIFEHTYHQAQIDVKYLPEVQAFNQLLMDSVHLVVATRLLNEKEKAYFAKIKITPRVMQIATDAMALMIHPQNPDTALNCQEILKVLSGEVTSWNQLSPNNRTGKITLVFDNANSSTVSYALNLIEKKQLPPNAYALKTNTAVVDYVANHPGAIGIIGYSWISDYDDPLTKKLRRDARLLSISPCDSDSPVVEYFKPYADNLIGKLYPFPRNVYVISREAYSGLGSGLSAFLGGEIGQRIIKKAGIPPYYKVEYNIELSSKPIKVE